MNRYPWWKYAILAVALVAGLLYTLPNLFGESPAVQISSAKATIKVDSALQTRVQQALTQAGLASDAVALEGNSVRARFADTDQQKKAKDALTAALNPDATNPSYIVALNLVSRSPHWLTAIRALPMYLGLDLRGGVHFLMQVDMKSALTKKVDSLTTDARTILRDKSIRHSGISRDGNTLVVNFRDAEAAKAASNVLRDQIAEMVWVDSNEGGELRLRGTLKPESAKLIQDQAIKQNRNSVHI